MTTTNIIPFFAESHGFVPSDGLARYFGAFHIEIADFDEPDFVDTIEPSIRDEYNIGAEELVRLRDLHADFLKKKKKEEDAPHHTPAPASSSSASTAAAAAASETQQQETSANPKHGVRFPYAPARHGSVPPVDRTAAGVPQWLRDAIPGDTDSDRCNWISYMADLPPTDVPAEEVFFCFYLKQLNPYSADDFKNDLVEHVLNGRADLLHQHQFNFHIFDSPAGGLRRIYVPSVKCQVRGAWARDRMLQLQGQHLGNRDSFKIQVLVGGIGDGQRGGDLSKPRRATWTLHPVCLNDVVCRPPENSQHQVQNCRFGAPHSTREGLEAMKEMVGMERALRHSHPAHKLIVESVFTQGRSDDDVRTAFVRALGPRSAAEDELLARDLEIVHVPELPEIEHLGGRARIFVSFPSASYARAAMELNGTFLFGDEQEQQQRNQGMPPLQVHHAQLHPTKRLLEKFGGGGGGGGVSAAAGHRRGRGDNDRGGGRCWGNDLPPRRDGGGDGYDDRGRFGSSGLAPPPRFDDRRGGRGFDYGRREYGFDDRDSRRDDYDPRGRFGGGGGDPYRRFEDYRSAPPLPPRDDGYGRGGGGGGGRGYGGEGAPRDDYDDRYQPHHQQRQDYDRRPLPPPREEYGYGYNGDDRRPRYDDYGRRPAAAAPPPPRDSNRNDYGGYDRRY